MHRDAGIGALRVIGLVLVLFAGRGASAATYTALAEAYAWTDSATHTNVVWTGAPGGPAAACTGASAATDDDISELLNIGFSFPYAGTAYTQVRIMSNGRLQFGNTYCGNGTQVVGPPPTYPLPYPDANVVRTIRIYGADLDPSAGGSVRYATTGTAPDREFVATWLDVPEWSQATSQFRLQMVLREDGSFVFRFGTSANPSGGKAQIGWEISTTDYATVTFTNIVALSGTALRFSPPEPLAAYRMEEWSWTGAASEVLDSTGNSRHGTSLGSAASTSSGKVCRGGLFSYNASGSVIAAVETGVPVGSAGTITFWARIDAAWTDGTARALIDAGRDNGAAASDRAFRLVKDGSGRLDFTLNNSAGGTVTALAPAVTSASGNWHHVAITWDFAAGRMTVYRNGASVATRTGAAITAATWSTIWVGDSHADVGASVAPSASGGIDEVRIYSYEGSATVIQRDYLLSRVCASIFSFRLQHDGSGIHCVNEVVDLEARDAASATVLDYTGNVTLDTQSGRGTWFADGSNAGTFSDGTADDGLATYTFAASDLGTVRFWLRYLAGATPLDVDAWETAAPSVRDDDAEGALAFGPSGFVVTASPLSNPPPLVIDTTIAAQTAAVALPLYLTAYGQTATDPDCGVIETYTGAKTISTWSSHLNPVSPVQSVAVNGSNVGTSSGTATALPVTFTLGQASVSVRYDDVGQIGVSFRDATVSDPVGGIPGASNSFVVKPSSFVVTNVERLDGTPNPGGTTPTDAVFVAAGNAFSVTVEARDADGDRTPSYGLESSPEGIEVRSASLLAPVGRNGSANDGTLGAGTSFSATAQAGAFENRSVTFDEVGAISLYAHVADASYLGAGDVVGSSSAAVGRFTPDHFDAAVAPVAFATGCTAGRFTYAGQSFDFAPGLHPAITVEAKSTLGGATQNYAGTWFRMTPAALATRSWSAATGTLDSAAPDDPRVDDLGAGVGLVSFDQGPQLAFTHTTPTAPFDAEIGVSVTLVDADGVAYTANPLAIGQPVAGQGIAFQDGNTVRFGRMAFQNAYGAEVRDLAVPLRAEYFNGTRFTSNTDDACTTFLSSNLALARVPVTLPTVAAVANAPLVAGEAGLTLSAPGAGQTGTVSLRLDLSPTGADLEFLQFDWDGDGLHDDDPTATATFGVYRGSDSRVHLRERY